MMTAGYAERLRGNGVQVTHSQYAGMIHGFYWMQAVLDQSRELHEEIAREVRRALHSRG
ncbi:MAG: hypothetical protein ACXVFW_06785 [Blastococcus sp.]